MIANLNGYFEVLGRLERIEAKLLTWGVVDGSFTREEICDEIDRVQADCGVQEDPVELLDQLVEHQIIFEFNDGGIARYRTRMAEAVRLFARLRQIRPWNTWQTAPTLVADFRFAVAQRFYPRRNIKAQDVLARVQASARLSSVGQNALSAMLRLGEDRPLALANFQARATELVLGDLEATGSRGMIVTAGTGTGKTKAFYLPALTYIAGLVAPGAFWTKALALYPRTELLKDQYSETYSEVLVVNEKLKKQLPRRITIGALFGDTPKRATLNDVNSWKSNGRYICPSLRCPKCNVGVLEWKAGDIHAGREVLSCLSCHFVSSDGDLALTRASLDRRPPDMLFSTTEMLNRCMSDSRRASLFGVGQPNAPRIVLLDEVHTYEGSHGAQVAYLLRRWRWAVRKKLQFTGLSATLENARDFFAQLTGLRPSSVVPVAGDDMEPKGVEYQLALRGDPVSATALLSTTIQCAMLLRRILDPKKLSGSDPTRFGQRAYFFADNLDVVNRLYFDLRDAEGDGPSHPRMTLASFRQHSRPQARERFRQGQSWKLCEDIGHDLSRMLAVDRTSSQDTGVNRGADIIVATASLEVGYNDPDVGAVAQHKAPRNMAAFLQRKGRAGRRPEMRPWVIVSLSDYGRDRFAYESYDQLFSPTLSARSLPVNNRYVLRMQGVFALMDWLARKMPRELPVGSLWMDCAGPAGERWKPRQNWLREFLKSLIEFPENRLELESYLKAALRIDRDELIALMWEPPRSIMMSVIPTLLRRLETDWRRIPLEVNDSEYDLRTDYVPLPDFVPPTLFSDLALPEVRIVPQTGGDTTLMPVLQALQILAPGNVTRRFAPYTNVLHWTAPQNLTATEQDLPVSTWCTESEFLGEFQTSKDGNAVSVPCMRPLQFRPAAAPSNVRPTSKGFLNWRSQVFVQVAGTRHSVPQNSPWSRVIDHLEFYIHAQNSNVTVRRFAIGAQANVGLTGGRGTERNISITFRQGDTTQPAAVGFVQDVDGIAVRFRYPDNLGVGPEDPNQEKIRSFRVAYFRNRLRSDATLKEYANDFQIDWLYQMYVSALSAEALSGEITLAQAHSNLVLRGLGGEMMRVLDVIFQTVRLDEEHEGEKGPEQKTLKRLEGLTSNPDILSRIAELASVLWQEPDTGWYEWARERFRATLGGALLEAAQRSSAQVDVEALWLDLHPGVPPPELAQPDGGEFEEIWITEQTLGGTGVIEEILRCYSEDPLRFLRLAQEALGPSDFELVDSELSRLVRRSREPVLHGALKQVRDSITNKELRDNVHQLRVVLQREGFVANHAVMTSLQARILRAGTDDRFDAELAEIYEVWRREEARLGIEVDLRVIAYVLSRTRELREALPFLPEVNLDDPQWRYQAYSSILWPRGNAVRNHRLSWWNPFSPTPDLDRLLVLDCLEAERAVIDVREADWRAKTVSVLQDKAAAILIGPADQPRLIKEALLSIVSDPLDIGFLYVFPQIESARRRGDSLELLIVCREAIR